MSLQLVAPIDYTGLAGVQQVRNLQMALTAALAVEDWDRVRRLDQSCAALIDRVICQNDGDTKAVIDALSELKGIYASLIVQCKRDVASMAH